MKYSSICHSLIYNTFQRKNAYEIPLRSKNNNIFKIHTIHTENIRIQRIPQTILVSVNYLNTNAYSNDSIYLMALIKQQHMHTYHRVNVSIELNPMELYYSYIWIHKKLQFGDTNK